MTSTRPIPGPRGTPVVGMMPEMMNDMLGLFMNLTREHGGIVQFKLFNIPMGVMIFITPYVTHRDAKFWTDPERFDPERFNPDQIAKRPAHVYFPFGEGPHICIGNNFALTEMQLILALALQRFHFKLAPGQKIELMPEATLRPKYGTV